MARKPLIPAVGYVRRSTDKQEKSLDDQRAEIIRYAEKHGYEIVRWYVDDAISGDDTENRLGFLAMRRDASERLDFDAIVVWDQDRFGRFDSLDAGHWIYPIRQAGVQLVTINEGPIDWDDFTGRMMYGIKQEGKHQFLRDLSNNTARGQVSNINGGFLCSSAPYGYDRMYVDREGNKRQRIVDGERFAKPKEWRTTLVVSEDPQKVETVRWIFAKYVENDIGLRAIASELNSRGVGSPRGGKWCIGTIRDILRNRAYVGDLVWNKRRQGKYSRISGGEIVKCSSGERASRNKPIDNDESEWIVNKDSHEALIDRETFQAIQDRLIDRKRRTGGHKGKHGDCYILSGLLHCGCCGGKMYGNRLTRKKNGRTYEYLKYVCSNYRNQGRDECGFCAVKQDTLLEFLLFKLRNDVLAGGRRDILERRIREKIESRSQADPDTIDRQRKALADLEGKITQGAKRIILVPDDVVDAVAAELSRMRRERDQLAAAIKTAERTKPADVESDVKAALDKLWTIAHDLESAPPARLRELIRRMVKRIELYFDTNKKGSRVERPFSKGFFELRPDYLSCSGSSVAGAGFEPTTSRL